MLTQGSSLWCRMVRPNCPAVLTAARCPSPRHASPAPGAPDGSGCPEHRSCLHPNPFSAAPASLGVSASTHSLERPFPPSSEPEETRSSSCPSSTHHRSQGAGTGLTLPWGSAACTWEGGMRAQVTATCGENTPAPDPPRSPRVPAAGPLQPPLDPASEPFLCPPGLPMNSLLPGWPGYFSFSQPSWDTRATPPSALRRRKVTHGPPLVFL